MDSKKDPSNVQARRRVVITGLGIASSIGMDETEVWENLLAGKTGIAPFQVFDATNHKIKIGAEIETERIQDKLARLKRRPVDRCVDLAVITAHDALEQARLVQGEPPFQEQETAVVFGTGEGTAQSHDFVNKTIAEQGTMRIRPTAVPKCMYNAISAGLSIQFKLTGPNFMLVSACTSAVNAIGTAFRMIRDGYEDTVLCGGSDSFFTPFYYGIWNNLPALSTIEDPERACRPFAEDRLGTILGEGAGALVLESYESAIERGATIRGEILGYGESSDAVHITKPNPDGQAKAMKRA